MVKAIFDALAQARPKNHFTVGIVDDVTHTSLALRRRRSTPSRPMSTTALFYGLGADGTVGANKNSIKIIGEETDLHVQGYFVYDSKKAGATTVSHLRTSPRPIRSAYLIRRRRFVACHQFEFLETGRRARTRGARGPSSCSTRRYAADEVWERLPREVQEQIDRQAVFASTRSMRRRWRARRAWAAASTRSCRPASLRSPASLPREEAIEQIKHAIEKTYSKRGAEVVKRNFEAVDATLAHLHEVPVPSAVTATHAPSAARVRAGARLRPADDGRAPGREGRSAAGQRLSGGRHVAGRHREVGKAEPRARDPGLGSERSASSATSARWCARMRPSGPRCTTPALLAARRRRSSRCPTKGSSSRRERTPFRWRPRTAPAAICA